MSISANLRYVSIKDIDFYMSNIDNIEPSREVLEEKMIVHFFGDETVDFEKKPIQ